MMDEPAFEVIIGNPNNPERHYKIWASGKTEGFRDGDKPCLINNRIPLLIAKKGEAEAPPS